MPNKQFLAFGEGNAKLNSNSVKIHHFSIPAGWSCPGALECWAKATINEGLIQDHPRAKYRCFSASMESLRPMVRAQRWNNFALLKAVGSREGMRDLVLASIPKRAQLVRIHIGGDFFSQAYFDAWCDAARARQDVRFYAYTKSLPFWVERILDMPVNLILTASRGGRFDHLIDRHSLKCVKVVFHPDEAAALGLEIDHDDSHAHSSGEDFALLIHGSQPAGSVPAQAISRLRREDNDFAYSAE
jgi:hypothetical protein